MKKTRKKLLESYVKKIVANAIGDYLMDNSDKVHINTIEDWVDDWYSNSRK